jgi:hypothetical protein
MLDGFCSVVFPNLPQDIGFADPKEEHFARDNPILTSRLAPLLGFAGSLSWLKGHAIA